MKTFGGCLALWMALVVVVFAGRSAATPQPAFDLKLAIMPGMQLGDIYLPHNCYYQYMMYASTSDLPCYSRDFSISFSIGADHRVTRVAYLESRTVGDFLTHWGDPVGVEDYHLIKYLYWQSGAFIAVIDDAYAPTGKALLYGFVQDLPNDLTAWRGFRR